MKEREERISGKYRDIALISDINSDWCVCYYEGGGVRMIIRCATEKAARTIAQRCADHRSLMTAGRAAVKWRDEIEV